MTGWLYDFIYKRNQEAYMYLCLKKNTKTENLSKPKQIVAKQRNRVEDVQRNPHSKANKKNYTHLQNVQCHTKTDSLRTL